MRYSLILFLSIMIAACGADKASKKITAEEVKIAKSKDQKDETQLTKVAFEETTYDFGDIGSKKTVSKKFTISNVGNVPLIISRVKPSCGCTVSKYPKEPVLPGESGTITIRFNPKGRKGKQHKIVTVFANTKEGKHQLSFTANIIE